MGHEGQGRDPDILLQDKEDGQGRIEPAGKERYGMSARFFHGILTAGKYTRETCYVNYYRQVVPAISP
jgi:hypothetical protein